MSARAPYRDPLVLFLAVTGLVLAWALWQRLAVPTFAETLVLLREGDLEHAERTRLWRTLLERGVESPERTLAAAMAAVCLGDEERYRGFAGQLGKLDAPLPVAADQLPAAALGEPCLEHLLRGFLLESQGQRDEAVAAYGQAAAGGRLWALPVAERLARQALLRLGVR